MTQAVQLTFPDGAWQGLLQKAYGLLSSLESQGIALPTWSLGGGTVLMFHYQHRLSKDIDIFIPDPQFLGFVNPRLSDSAEQLTSHYDESTEFIKLRFDEGEIDFIATAPLTAEPFFVYEVLGKTILLETPLEIVAKKMWHRGNRATARDLLDLSLVISQMPEAFYTHKALFLKHASEFVRQCHARKAFLKPQFEQIDRINVEYSYKDCLEIVEVFFKQLVTQS